MPEYYINEALELMIYRRYKNEWEWTRAHIIAIYEDGSAEIAHDDEPAITTIVLADITTTPAGDHWYKLPSAV